VQCFASVAFQLECIYAVVKVVPDMLHFVEGICPLLVWKMGGNIFSWTHYTILMSSVDTKAIQRSEVSPVLTCS
jgi:hypothetical protein